MEKLAKLARIELSGDETDSFVKEIDSIIGYVDQIQSVGTTTPQATTTHSQTNVMREDVHPHETGFYTKDIIDGAPDKEGNYIKVKKIL